MSGPAGPTTLRDALAAARAHHKAGRLDDAVRLYRAILAQTPAEAPAHASALHLLGMALHAGGHTEPGLAYVERAIALRPDAASYHNNRGSILQALGRLDEARAAYAHALALRPAYPAAHYNLGALHQSAGRHAEAEAAYRAALVHDAGLIDASVGLASLLVATGRVADAERVLDAAAPDDGRVARGRADLARAQGRMLEALPHYQAAARALPREARSFNDLGAALQTTGRLAPAARAFRRALELDPRHGAAWYNLARALDDLGRADEAMAAYERAYRLDPASAARTLCYAEYLLRKRADWTDYDARRERLLDTVRAHLARPGAVPLPPLTLNIWDVPGALRAAVARHQAAAIEREVPAPLPAPAPRPRPDGRLRLGYVSPDLRRHAVGALVQDLFALHDRSRFEVVAYSLVDVQDEVRARIQDGVDRFVDASALGTAELARRIRDDGIDVLIDLGGYTTHTRTALFAHRPAPVQAHWIGYLDTMGAPFLPYLLADAVAVPDAVAADCTETVVRLPDCFLPVSRLDTAEAPATRAEVGLPDDAFVFCSFNAHHKIDPGVWDVWMDILRRVPRSVLWLAEGIDEAAHENLRREARDRGIGPTRLVFAPRRPMPEYVAQHRLADLFLDTFVYNAGTTAVCALWAGLPVLTRPGASFLSRMGTSLATAAGLPELVADDASTYADRAVALAHDPEALAALRTRLIAREGALFDLPRFVRDLEDTLERLAQEA